MDTRLVFVGCALVALAGCAKEEPLLCGGGSVAVDGSCVMLDLGGHDSGTDLAPDTGDATADASDAGMDMPDLPPDMPDLGDLGVDLGPVYMIDPCLDADGGFGENHLHIEADPTSTVFSGGTDDVVGGTWSQMSPAFMAYKLTVNTMDIRDGGPPPTGPYWSITLGAPSGSGSLGAMRYEGAVKTTTMSTVPTMDIAYNGASCGSLTGRFDIQNVDVLSSGGYTHLRATFEETCGGTTPSTIRGCIVYSP